MTYIVQIDDLVRDATAEEIAQIEAIQSEEESRKIAEAEKAAAKAALLDRLGITSEEAKLLVG